MSAEFSGNITKCHQKLHDILNDMGFTVIDNAEFDLYRIDCFVDEINTGFEADGVGYHWKKRDAKRDEYLLNKFGVKIFRVSDKDLTTKAKIDKVRKDIMEFVKNG